MRINGEGKGAKAENIFGEVAAAVRGGRELRGGCSLSLDQYFKKLPP